MCKQVLPSTFEPCIRSGDLRIVSGGLFIEQPLTFFAPFIQDANRRDAVSRRVRAFIWSMT